MSSKQNIDIQKLHLAPKAVQFLAAIALGVVLVVVGYFASFKTQLETLETAKTTEMDDLRPKYEKIAVKVANLENLEQELVLIEQSISELIKQLPTDAELPNLIQELHMAAASNQLKLNTVVPRKKAKEDDNIDRLPFFVSVTGSYEQLANFVRDVGRMSRIVTLSAITIKAADEDNKPTSNNDKKAASKISTRFTLTAIASTYKAVDTEKPAASAASGAATTAQ